MTPWCATPSTCPTSATTATSTPATASTSWPAMPLAAHGEATCLAARPTQRLLRSYSAFRPSFRSTRAPTARWPLAVPTLACALACAGRCEAWPSRTPTTRLPGPCSAPPAAAGASRWAHQTPAAPTRRRQACWRLRPPLRLETSAHTAVAAFSRRQSTTRSRPTTTPPSPRPPAPSTFPPSRRRMRRRAPTSRPTRRARRRGAA